MSPLKMQHHYGATIEYHSKTKSVHYFPETRHGLKQDMVNYELQTTRSHYHSPDSFARLLGLLAGYGHALLGTETGVL